MGIFSFHASFMHFRSFVYTAAKASFSSLDFIYLNNSYNLTVFVDEFCNALGNIINSPSTQITQAL